MAAGRAPGFVKSVRLARPKLTPKLVSKTLYTPDYGEQGFVVGGGVVSFTDRLKGQQKEDVLNSTLFCQLAADYYYNRDTEEWYEHYVDVMGKLGYVIETFDFRKYESDNTTFTMDKPATNILASIASDNEMVVLNSTLDAFGAMDDHEDQVVLFDAHSTRETHGGYQMFPCTTDSNNDVVLYMGGFYFTSGQYGVKILFYDYHSHSTSLYKSVQKCILNQEVYSLVRQAVIDELGDRALYNILNIPHRH